MKNFSRGFFFLASLLEYTTAFASHSYGGLDLCALYPEIMPPGLNAELLPEPKSKAAALMQNYCIQCHALPGPGRHTAKEWPQVLEHMQTLMDVSNRFGGLMGNIKTPSATEQKQLQQYLSQYALKPIQQKPQGIGASAFENHCGACHALPDPTYYATQWPQLIKRMQHNMSVMKYSPPSVDVVIQIQHFLQQYAPANSTGSSTIESFDSSKQKNLKQNRPLHFESWLALGPFLLLVILGFIRWWHSMQKAKNTGRQMRPL